MRGFSNPWNSVIENASPFDIRNSLFDIPLLSVVPLISSTDSGCENLIQLVSKGWNPFSHSEIGNLHSEMPNPFQGLEPFLVVFSKPCFFPLLRGRGGGAR